MRQAAAAEGRRLGWGVAAILVGAVIAGCSTDIAPSVAARQTPPPSASLAPLRGPVDAVAIQVDDIAFHVEPVRIEASPRLVTFTLTNVGRLPHTLTFYSNPGTTELIAGGDTGFVQPGQSAELRFTAPAGATTVYFLCTIHPTQMYGGLTVG